jgi:hypothetical protein
VGGVSDRARLRRLERLLALREAAAGRARHQLARRISQAAAAAARVARVGRLIEGCPTGPATAAELRAGAELRALLQATEAAARAELRQSVARRSEAERLLAEARVRAERLAERAAAVRRTTARHAERRLEDGTFRPRCPRIP